MKNMFLLLFLTVMTGCAVGRGSKNTAYLLTISDEAGDTISVASSNAPLAAIIAKLAEREKLTVVWQHPAVGLKRVDLDLHRVSARAVLKFIPESFGDCKVTIADGKMIVAKP